MFSHYDNLKENFTPNPSRVSEMEACSDLHFSFSTRPFNGSCSYILLLSISFFDNVIFSITDRPFFNFAQAATGD